MPCKRLRYREAFCSAQGQSDGLGRGKNGEKNSKYSRKPSRGCADGMNANKAAKEPDSSQCSTWLA